MPLMFGAVLLMAPRTPPGGCGASGRFVELAADGGEPTRLLLGAQSSYQYGSSSLPTSVDTVEWQGDNFSRLLLIGADPEVSPFPPLAPLVAGRGPSQQTVFTSALEVAWPLSGQSGPMSLDTTIRGVFADGIQAVRSIDVGACSLPMPWIVDPDRLDLVPRGWTAVTLLSEGFQDENGLPIGLAQFILKEIDRQARAQEGPRWSKGFRANILSIRPTSAPGAQMFWYDMGPGSLGSETDEFCLASNYLVDARATLFGFIPVTASCDETVSIRFCGRFDTADVTDETPAGVRFTMTRSEVERTSRRGPCGRLMDTVRSEFEDTVENDLEGELTEEFNAALARQSLVALRVEHSPSRLEIVLLDDEDAAPPGTLVFAGLCRDEPFWRGDVGVIPTTLGDGRFVP
ncbi:MAG: hypothetical protein R3B40_04090 [Polyangiales bacterium]